MPTGDVNMVILDGGGAVSVPGSSVQAVFGCASAGPIAQVFATRNPNTLVSTFGQGPLVEYAAMCIAAGGTPLCLRTTSNTAGKVLASDTAAVNISSSTNDNPSVVTTATPHGRKTGDVVTIAGHLVNTAIVGTWKITVLSSTTFSVPVAANGVGAATGTVTFTGINQLTSAGAVGAGTSNMTVTGVPFDTAYWLVEILTSGTVGTAGIKFRVSLDAGRSWGPDLALGTASTFVITDTGLTLVFENTKTLVDNDLYRFTTVEPTWNTAGVLAAMNALQASQYAIAGWGTAMLLGDVTGANATTIQGYLQTWETAKIYSRLMGNARDASPPTAWAGTGEVEATWMTSVLADFAATATKRAAWSAGHYNMGSKIPKALAGAPRYRRPLSWALAARQVAIQPQRHAGRVRDGSLVDVALDPINDALDGFIYHDERQNPGFDGARFVSGTTRIKKKGFWIKNPNLMSDTGSVFTLLPLGIVMDIACGIVNEVGTEDINDDIRLNENGTIYENEALAIEKRMGQAIKDNMLAKNMISSYRVLVDRTNNVQGTSAVNVAVTIWARGYVLEENITIGYGNAADAA